MTQNIRASDNFVGSCEDTRNINTLNILYTYTYLKRWQETLLHIPQLLRKLGSTVIRCLSLTHAPLHLSQVNF